MATTRIYADQSAWIDADNPNANHHTGSDLRMGGSAEKVYSLIHFDASPIIRKRIISPSSISIYIGSPATDTPSYTKCVRTWNEESVTYNTRPYSNIGRVSTSEPLKANAWRILDAQWVGDSRVGYDALAKYGIAITNYSLSPYDIIKSSRDVNRPYADVTYENTVPTQKSISPINGFIDDRADNTFSWLFDYDPYGVVGVVIQAAAKIEWREYGSSTIHTINITGGAQSHTIPADTFPHGEIEWRLSVMSDDSVWSAPSSWYHLSTQDVLSTAVALTPADQYIDAASSNTFAWQHITSTGSLQHAFDIQINEGAGWATLLAHIITADTQYTIPADTLPTGQLSWRVRTYNTEDAAGAWSNALSVYVIGVPKAATITNVLPTGRPTVFWESEGQQIWQLQILRGAEVLYDTGNMPGVQVRSHKVTAYIDDGSHTARVRIRNEYDFWSEWGAFAFTVSTVKPPAPTLTVAANFEYALRIVVAYTTPECLLYRRILGNTQWRRIALLTSNEYWDNTPASGARYEYLARAVQADDSFTDSATKVGGLTLKLAVLSCGDAILPIEMRTSPGYGRGHSQDTGKALSNFVGRTYPAAEKTGFKERTESINCFILQDSLPVLLALGDAGVILYRDEAGDKYYCTVTGLRYEDRHRDPRKRGYDCNIDLHRVNYEEGTLW